MTLERVTTALSSRYRVIHMLGAGRTTTVYRAQDLKLQRDVAIRVMHPELASTHSAARFLRGAQIASMLQHPNILSMLDVDTPDGLAYCVTPYIEITLEARLLHEKQLPLDDALRLARQVAGALAYTHQNGIIHRDIKPANILLDGDHAMLVDFESARVMNVAGARMIGSPGIIVGTPPYMSPEQASGDRNADGRSDIYSLGCVLYEMLAGEPPFKGLTPQAMLERVENARPLQQMRASVPDAVSAILTTAMAKTPADRYATASEFAAALDAVPR